MPELRGPGAGGRLAPLIFGRSVNPIPTGEGRLSPPITTGTSKVFHLPASLLTPEVGGSSVWQISKKKCFAGVIYGQKSENMLVLQLETFSL